MLDPLLKITLRGITSSLGSPAGNTYVGDRKVSKKSPCRVVMKFRQARSYVASKSATHCFDAGVYWPRIEV